MAINNLELSKNPPILLFTLGATGSGKSSLVHEVLRILNNNKANDAKYEAGNFKSILIDDIIESHPCYRKQVISRLKDECPTNTSNTSNTNNIKLPKMCNELKDKVEAHDKALISNLSKIYYDIRKKKKCNHTISNSTTNITNNMCNNNNNNKVKCEHINDIALIAAIKKQSNIIIESRGVDYPNWIFESNEYNLQGYYIIFTYSFVSMNKLFTRNKNRFYAMYNAYLTNTTKPVPRLPNIEKEFFAKMLAQIKTTLINLIRCKQNKPIETNNSDLKFNNCNRVHILVFSNNEQRTNTSQLNHMQLLFNSANMESYNESQFSKQLDDILALDQINIQAGGNNFKSKLYPKITTKLNTKYLKTKTHKIKYLASNNKFKTKTKKHKTYKYKRTK